MENLRKRFLPVLLGLIMIMLISALSVPAHAADDTVDLTVKKVWVKKSESDIIPDQLEVYLLTKTEDAEGNATYTPVGNYVLTADTTPAWSYTVTGLPVKDESGTTIVYVWSEQYTSGWMLASNVTANNVTTLTNTPIDIYYPTTDYEGTKTWQDNVWPNDLTVILHWSCGGQSGIVTQDASGNPALEVVAENASPTGTPLKPSWQGKDTAQWKYTFGNLPMFNLSTGEIYSYWATEETPAGFEQVSAIGAATTYVLEAPDQVTVTPCNDLERWFDYQNKGDLVFVSVKRTAGQSQLVWTQRPITEQEKTNLLSALGLSSAEFVNGVPCYYPAGTNENNYNYGFGIVGKRVHVNFRAHSDWAQFSYGVMEVQTYSAGSTAFINKQAKTSVTGTKTWIDGGQSHTNASEITLKLLRKVKESNDDPVEVAGVTPTWDGSTYTFSNLDKYDTSGKEYEYSVTEAAITGYTTTQDGYNFTNTKTTTVTGTKTWNDGGKIHNNDSDITLTLKRSADNGREETVTVADPITFAWNGDTYTYSNLPAYDTAGNEYTYSVTEAAIDGYATSQSGFNFVNTELTTVSGTKTWNDGGLNHDNASEITLTLLRKVKESNDDPVEVTGVTPTWDGSTYTFINLDKYDTSGKEYEYSVTEAAITGYTTTQDGFNFVNTLETTVSGTKTWNDGGLTHDNTAEIKLTLSRTANGKTETVTVADPITFAWNGNTYTYSHLPAYDADGNEYTYSVAESTVSGYSTVQSGFNFINTKLTEATVKKVWSDDEDRDGIRPAELAVTLSSGVKVTLNESNNWQATVPNLPMYDDNGKLITYTWTEAALPDGYTLTKTETAGTVTTLTNSYDPELINIEGEKIWEDDDDRDGLRPENITLVLKADGTELLKIELEPDDNGNWTFNVTKLPRYKDHGKEIVYTVE